MTKKKNIPDIRFKGFSEEWEECELGEKVDIFSGLTYSPNDVIKDGGTFVLRSSNVKNGEIINADNVYVNSDVVNCDNVRVGDIIIVVRNGSRSLIGKHAQVKKEMKNTVIGAFMTGIHSKQSTFINALLDTSQFNKEIEKNLGATINQITNGALKKMLFKFTTSKEQTKIGNYFKNLDQLITQHQQKYDKLLTIKKAMLKKMFPQNGANVPEIRFKGFSGEWEEKKLNEISILITKGTTPLDKSGNGHINFIKIENIDNLSGKISITTKITNEQHENYLKRSRLMENDILFSIAGTLGRVTIINKDILPANTNQALAIIRLKQECLDYIVTYLRGRSVNNYIKKNPTVGAQPNLSLEQIGNIDLLLPSYEEQTKIGNFFKNFDNIIALNNQKIEKLKNIKKAFLDKMFV